MTKTKKRINVGSGSNPLKNVEFSDRIRTHVDTQLDGHWKINFESLEDTKQVIFDEDALTTFNQRVSEEIIDRKLKVLDPRAKFYVAEFAERLASELYRNGLIIFEEIPEGPDDAYGTARKRFGIN